MRWSSISTLRVLHALLALVVLALATAAGTVNGWGVGKLPSGMRNDNDMEGHP